MIVRVPMCVLFQSHIPVTICFLDQSWVSEHSPNNLVERDAVLDFKTSGIMQLDRIYSVYIDVVQKSSRCNFEEYLPYYCRNISTILLLQ